MTPDTSLTSIKTPVQKQVTENDAAPRRAVLRPEWLAAAGGSRHQYRVLRRVALDVLHYQQANPRQLVADTLTRFLESLAGRLNQLNIVAAPEQLTRAGVAMWAFQARQDGYRYESRREMRFRKKGGEE